MFPLTKWHAAWLAVAVTVCIAAGAVTHLRRARQPTGPVRVTELTAPAVSVQPVAGSPLPQTRRAHLYVHVSGQVAHPGLYRLQAGARVMDAVTGAGGATGDANLDALNLATTLSDGQKLVVPGFGEAPPGPEPDYILDSPTPPAAVLVRADPPPVPLPDDMSLYLPEYGPVAPPATVDPLPPISPGAGSLGIRPAWTGSVAAPGRAAPSSDKLRNPGDGVVNINAAGERELQRLPGVGPATAAKILEYRRAHGGFRTVEELMEVKGIGEKKLAKMAPFVVL